MHRISRTLPQLPWKGLVAPVRPALLAVLAVLALTGLNASKTYAAQGLEGLQGPDVTIIAQEAKTIYEFRQAGQLRMVRIVPKWGKPYYLVPRDRTQGFGDLERADMLLPSWVIIEF
jgi:hypothetical protein